MGNQGWTCGSHFNVLALNKSSSSVDPGSPLRLAHASARFRTNFTIVRRGDMSCYTILSPVFVLSPNSLPSRQNSVTGGTPTGLQEQTVLIPPVMCAPLPAAICWKRWIETGLQTHLQNIGTSLHKLMQCRLSNHGCVDVFVFRSKGPFVASIKVGSHAFPFEGHQGDGNLREAKCVIMFQAN